MFTSDRNVSAVEMAACMRVSAAAARPAVEHFCARARSLVIGEVPSLTLEH